MRIVSGGESAEVDLVECEAGARCTFERRCRIHALYDFFKQAGLVAERSSLELPPPKPARPEPIYTTLDGYRYKLGPDHKPIWIDDGFPRECEFGRID